MVRERTARAFADATRPLWFTVFLMESAKVLSPSVSETATAKSITNKATHAAAIVDFMFLLFASLGEPGARATLCVTI